MWNKINCKIKQIQQRETDAVDSEKLYSLYQIFLKAYFWLQIECDTFQVKTIDEAEWVKTENLN